MPLGLLLHVSDRSDIPLCGLSRFEIKCARFSWTHFRCNIVVYDNVLTRPILHKKRPKTSISTDVCDQHTQVFSCPLQLVSHLGRNGCVRSSSPEKLFTSRPGQDCTRDQAVFVHELCDPRELYTTSQEKGDTGKFAADVKQASG